MSKRLSVALLIATSIASLAGVSLGASSIAPLDLTTLDARSPLVVCGYVVKVTTIHDKAGLFEQHATLRIASVLRGTITARTIRVRMRTGLVFFDRMLVKGDSGVFYLNRVQGDLFEAAYPGSFALFRNDTVQPLAP
jgi:hypothetical protein